MQICDSNHTHFLTRFQGSWCHGEGQLYSHRKCFTASHQGVTAATAVGHSQQTKSLKKCSQQSKWLRSSHSVELCNVGVATCARSNVNGHSCDYRVYGPPPPPPPREMEALHDQKTVSNPICTKEERDGPPHRQARKQPCYLSLVLTPGRPPKSQFRTLPDVTSRVDSCMTHNAIGMEKYINHTLPCLPSPLGSALVCGPTEQCEEHKNAVLC